MDFGVSTAIVGAILVVVQFVKKRDTRRRLKRIYWFLPIPFATLAAVIMTRPLSFSTVLGWQELGKNVILYWGATVVAYTLKNVKKG